jgi:hypothetical protein
MILVRFKAKLNTPLWGVVIPGQQVDGGEPG